MKKMNNLEWSIMFNETCLEEEIMPKYIKFYKFNCTLILHVLKCFYILYFIIGSMSVRIKFFNRGAKLEIVLLFLDPRREENIFFLNRGLL